MVELEIMLLKFFPNKYFSNNKFNISNEREKLILGHNSYVILRIIEHFDIENSFYLVLFYLKLIKYFKNKKMFELF